MTDETPTIGALGGYTNNQMNREGIKKLVNKIDAVSDDVADVTTELATKQDKLTAGTGIEISDENVISALGGFGFTEVTLPEGTTLKKYVTDNASTKDFIIKCDADLLYLENGWSHGGVGINANGYRLICADTSNPSFNTAIKIRSILGFKSNFNLDDGYIAQILGFDDTVIDSTNIDTYIDANNGYVVTKSFMIRITNGNFGQGTSIICKGEKTFQHLAFNEPSSYVSEMTITSREIYDLVKSNVSSVAKTILVISINEKSVNYTGINKLYERSKLIQ